MAARQRLTPSTVEFIFSWGGSADSVTPNDQFVMYPTNLSVTSGGQNILLIIDPQVDFHTGSLAVPGANGDAERIAKFINTNEKLIGEIFITLDSHHKRHIAHQSFWENEKGDQPPVFSEIFNKDIVERKWRPRDIALQEHCEYYTQRLEEGGQFTLTIWPDHCLIGSRGHTVEPNIQKAVREWDVNHYKKQVHHIHKGMNCLTEMYSAVRAEVEIETDSSTTQNTELLHELRKAGKLIICGQAMSHCVNWTTRHIVEDWEKHRSCMLKDIILLTDGASSVKGFKHFGDDFVTFMRNKGCTVVTCEEAGRELLPVYEH